MEELSTRKKIYETIVLNPGMHFRELQRFLSIPVGMLEYHLSVLEKNGLVVSKDDGRYKRYFANTTMTQEERKIMGLLRNNITRNIVIFLLENGRSKHADILRNFDISPSTLSYHLNKLVKKGIVVRESIGRENYYEIRHPETVANTIIKYRKSFLDSVVDNFAEWWLGHKK